MSIKKIIFSSDVLVMLTNGYVIESDSTTHSLDKSTAHSYL